ncbi:MAG: hypothetical protein CMM77_08505 [Rhodospirillaceae bacterium]|nr:hypothetical protein [Magnetovibrio sp.]MAY67154.1 hypothetical protein [Rhodospirillaceae bacterium]
MVQAGLGVAVLAVAAGPADAADCPPFPSDPYVGTVSHETVIDYVDRHLAGDWSRYIQLQAERIRRLDALARQNKPLAVRHKGGRVDLTGPALDRYIAQARTRLQVLHCLSGNSDAAVMASAGTLNDFATASGRDQAVAAPNSLPAAKSQPPAPQTAQAPQTARVALRSVVANPPKPPHDVAITASCDGADARIKVVNLGAPFPAPGNITVFRLDADRQVVKARRMLLAAKQVSSFTVKGQAGVTQRYGVFVDPSWYFRGQTVDAALTCG